MHDISYYRDKGGDLMLYAGEAQVCSGYTVTGSLSDTRRNCLRNLRTSPYQYSVGRIKREATPNI